MVLLGGTQAQVGLQGMGRGWALRLAFSAFFGAYSLAPGAALSHQILVSTLCCLVLTSG
jgi:hypothetical protein